MRQAYLFVGFLIIIAGGGFTWISREVLVPNRQANALLEKGKMWLEQQSEEALRKAVENFTEIAATYPDSRAANEATMYLAESYERLGLKDIALGKYRKLLEENLDAKNADLIKFRIAKLQILRSYTDEGMAQLLSLLGQARDGKMRSEIYAEIGKYYQGASQVENAIRNYRIAIRENPDNREAQLLLAKLLSDGGQADAALTVYDDYMKFQSQISVSGADGQNAYRREALQRGLLLLDQKKFTEAEKYFNLIHEKFPDSAEAEDALYYAGNARMRSGDYTGAIKMFNKTVGNGNKTRDEAAYIKKGEAWYHRHEYKKAAAVFAFVQRNYANGQFQRIAADWEEECIRAMSEGKALSEPKKEKVEPKEEESPVILPVPRRQPATSKEVDELERRLLQEADRAIEGQNKKNLDSEVSP